MTARSDVQPGVVAAGAGVALAVIVPLVLLWSVLRALDVVDADSRRLLAVLYVAVLVALGAGGHRAAGARPDRGLTHGMLAAIAAMAAFVVLALVRATVTDGDIPLAGLLTHFAMAAVAGMVGALIALRKGHQ